MDRKSADAQETYTTVAGQWANQVQAYRQSVALFREVGALRARRRRTMQAAPAVLPAPVANQSAAAPDQQLVLRLLPPNDAPTEQPASTAACPLTRRQLEVVKLIAQGMTNAQIARALVLTSGTVANHIEHILRRLDVPNRSAAVTWLAREQPRLLTPSTESLPEAPGRN